MRKNIEDDSIGNDSAIRISEVVTEVINSKGGQVDGKNRQTRVVELCQR